MKFKTIFLSTCLVSALGCFNANAAQRTPIDYEGDTEIHLAIRNCEIERALSLINTATFSTNNRGWSPIHELAANRAIDSDTQKTLFDIMFAKYKDAGINIDNLKTENGKNALSIALLGGNFTAARYLIENGCDAKQRFLKGSNALMLAARYGADVEFLNWLKDKVGDDINFKNEDEWTIIHYAAVGDNIEAIEFYLRNGGIINSKQKDGQTALHIASFHNNTSTVEHLINKGINITIRDFHYRLAEQLGNEQTKNIFRRKHLENSILSFLL